MGTRTCQHRKGDLKITGQPGEAQQNDKLGFTVLSHQIGLPANPENGGVLNRSM